MFGEQKWNDSDRAARKGVRSVRDMVKDFEIPNVHSFITYRGVFMGPGYDLGDVSIWRELSTYDRDDDYRW